MSLKIAVLLGGTSAERDVSLVTGIEIARTLVKNDYYVEAIDCAYGVQKIDFNDHKGNRTIGVVPADIQPTEKNLNKNIFKTIHYLIEKQFDLVFNALHGGYGEDGQLQVLLNLAGIKYTGSDYLASGLAMDKNLSKILFKEANIPTASWLHFSSPTQIKDKVVNQLNLPLVIKPNDQGSTVGLTVIRDLSMFSPATEKAFQYSKSVIIEEYIPGKEITIPILGTKSLPIIEIIPETGIYDYESKYQSGKCQYIVPAKIPSHICLKLQNLALKAYHLLGCRHYGRVDFRLTEDMKPFCLEVNTLPGMTPTSLVPKSARSIGLDFSDLIEKIVQLALD